MKNSDDKYCSWRYRLVAALLLLVCACILAAAFFVVPQPWPTEAESQLGLPPCGFLERSGYPCPTCGMTTAFAYVVRGNLIKGFITQPAGTIGALLCIVVGGLAAFVIIAGKRVDKYVDFILFNTGWLLAIGVVIILFGWAWTCLRMK